MAPVPILLSPALPSELLAYILNHHVYPTTLVLCSTRKDFSKLLQQDLQQQSSSSRQDRAGCGSRTPAGEADQYPPDLDKNDEREVIKDQLLCQTLGLVSVSRHIRTVYVPTVTHLRSWLSVFSPENTNLAGPPPNFKPPSRTSPIFIVYGVIELHRDTSEWSAQGLGNTVAALVETANRVGWGLTLIESKRQAPVDQDDGCAQEESHLTVDFGSLLEEQLPILSGSARRAGLEADAGGWSGRTVEVGRAMSRWFKFQRGPWDVDKDQTDHDHNGEDVMDVEARDNEITPP